MVFRVHTQGTPIGLFATPVSLALLLGGFGAAMARRERGLMVSSAVLVLLHMRRTHQTGVPTIVAAIAIVFALGYTTQWWGLRLWLQAGGHYSVFDR